MEERAMSRPAPVKVCVVTGFGFNADEELAASFSAVGADAKRVHVSDLTENSAMVRRYRILAFPGGFSFGDHLGSGKVFALLLKRTLKTVLEDFVADGGLVIGICNGFQVLVKLGLLPNLSGSWEQEVSLIHNDSGKFEDRWIRVSFDPKGPCLWTQGLPPMDLQVRHGEGKFVARSTEILEELQVRGMAAVRYCARDGGQAGYPENPNGSAADIAGITDTTGRILGLMPHPEAFLFPETHPDRNRMKKRAEGLEIFRAGVTAAGR
jgi:phosphoribosylformylglycinamidine synthase